MTCQTCKGAGHVAGHWMPELCPACNGAGDMPLHPSEPDLSLPWWLIAALVIPLVVVGVLQWGVWSLILAVFA